MITTPNCTPDTSSIRRRLLLAGTALAALGATACSTTQLRHVWSLPEHARTPVRRLLVIGISRVAAPRRAFEDTYVEELKAAGVEAVASHRLIGADGPQSPEVIARAVADAKADGITVSQYVGTERSIVRDTSHWERVDIIGMRRFSMAYSGAWVRVYEPVETEIVRVIGQTSVYRASDGELLWSAITEAAQPTDLRAATRSFAKAAIDEMKKSKII